MMTKILVSACLLGQPVRYNGTAKPVTHPLLRQWCEEGRVVACCPELAAGMTVPRPPCEIASGRTAQDVIEGSGRVWDSSGADVTVPFLAGAGAALAMARSQDCRYALLTDGSPSCGCHAVYDGTFSHKRIVGAGITATVLRQGGVQVFAEEDIEQLGQTIRDER